MQKYSERPQSSLLVEDKAEFKVVVW